MFWSYCRSNTVLELRSGFFTRFIFFSPLICLVFVILHSSTFKLRSTLLRWELVIEAESCQIFTKERLFVDDSNGRKRSVNVFGTFYVLISQEFPILLIHAACIWLIS